MGVHVKNTERPLICPHIPPWRILWRIQPSNFDEYHVSIIKQFVPDVEGYV